ncbi:MAG: hypothetical protein HY049_09805 [Acidobacteria bacterium]|nr:hypothetical protein [Acidobacteriota bacterium]
MSEKREGSTRLRNIARESEAEPPSRAHIDALAPRGDLSLAIDLAGLSLLFHGLDAALHGDVSRRFAAYVADPTLVSSPLRVEVHRDAVEHYVEPERGKPEGYYRLRIVPDRELIRLVTYSMAGWIDLASLTAGLSFGTGTFDPAERAFENFCRVAVACLAVRRGGFFIHGASIERHGRAYIFFGKSASGKSTLAKMNTEGRVISDDLTLVVPEPSGELSVAGSPFRGTYEGGKPVTGLFPLAAMFRLVQDETTFVERRPRVQTMAEVVANLPFVNESLNQRPDLFDALDESLKRVPIFFLHFRKEPDFWGAVDGAVSGKAPLRS